MASETTAAILGTGSYVPERRLTNADLEKTLNTSDEWITTRTGIKERRIAADGEVTSDMCLKAAQLALKDAGLTPEDLDLIIIATLTPDHPMPSTGCILQQKLGLGEKGIPGFDLNAACSGYLYALSCAKAHIESGMAKTVLVVGAEALSRIVDYQDRGTCILFGDGAGAVVLSAVPDTSGPALLHHKMHAEGNGFTMLCVPGGGSRTPASQMSINERLHYIKMQGREVYKLAVKRNLELVESTLEEAGIKPDELAIVIPHQSNLRIIESARQRLGLPPERMFCNIQKYGNTSAASVPLGLNECRKTGRVKSGDLVLMVAFGAGLTWGSVLVRI